MPQHLENNRNTKSVVVLGKGTLAIKIADFFNKSLDFSLLGIVPVLPEPKWTDSFSGWANQQEINVVNLESLILSGMKVDLAFSCYYDKILKNRELQVFSKSLNLHNAPLPKYRGVNPINWALKNNEVEHGVTIHLISTGIDDGPIIGQVKFSINPEMEEVIDVYSRALHFGYALFVDVITNLEKIVPLEQDHSLSSYYSKENFKDLGERQGLNRKVNE